MRSRTAGPGACSLAPCCRGGSRGDDSERPAGESQGVVRLSPAIYSLDHAEAASYRHPAPPCSTRRRFVATLPRPPPRAARGCPECSSTLPPAMGGADG
jgi:hypothetical protein